MLQTKPEFLSRADLDLIHEHSLRVLREVGVVVPSDEALAVFQAHGARVDGKRVYLDAPLVARGLASAPCEFTVRARDAARSVTIGGDRHVFAPGYGAPFITDGDGASRPATLQDYEGLTRLVDALPNLDLCGHMVVEPSDVPASAAHLHMLRTSMVNSSKPFMGSTEGARGARASIEMAGILFGDQEALRERPSMISLINTLSPLSFSQEMLDALMTHAAWRQPVLIAAMVQAGATGPVTIGGALVQQNAEILTGITLAQLVGPGTPVIYGSTSTAIDMRNGGLTIGCPELSVFIACTAQMARYYHLPSRAGGALTDAHLPDAQAGMESMMALLTAVQCGVNFVLHTGGILSGYLSMSCEKLVLDDEMCGAVRRYERGPHAAGAALGLTAEDLAYDVIAHVGPGGSYLMEQHTLERCHSEFYRARIANRQGMNEWNDRGRRNVVESARARCQALLAEHRTPTLDADIVAQLDHYVEVHS